MRTAYHFLALSIFLGCAFSQSVPPPPVALDQMTTLLANQDFADVSEIEGLVQTRGIAFDLDKLQLSRILEAASKGERKPDEIAVLILTSLKACHSCRARALEPLTIEEIKSLQAWGFADSVISEEARIRGVKDLAISQAAVEQLKALSIRENVIAFLVPDDRIPTPPIDGYQIFNLKRAEEYDPSTAEGFLKVTTSLYPSSQSEFVFKHNGLFVKAVKGMEPTDLGAYFNKPTPSNTDVDLIDISSGFDEYEEKGSRFGFGKKKESPLEVVKLKADADGRTAFRIVLVNKDASRSQRVSFFVRWHMLAEPKTASPAPSDDAVVNIQTEALWPQLASPRRAVN